MSQLSIKWNKFTVHKKHDIDRDAPYLWVFGVLVDADTLASRQFVLRRPAAVGNLGQKKFKKGESVAVSPTLDIVKTVQPVLGFLAAGVVVVAWENAMTSDKVTAEAYDAAADTINDFIVDRVESGNLTAPSDAEIDKLKDEIEDEVRRTIKEGWTIFQLLPDHFIGSADRIRMLSQSVTEALNFRFIKGSTDYQLQGELKFTK
jgi:hypothetical protein